jgi:hypothetical protein
MREELDVYTMALLVISNVPMIQILGKEFCTLVHWNLFGGWNLMIGIFRTGREIPRALY